MFLFRKKVPSSDWKVVLTDKDREFYWNPQLQSSVWTMPEEVREGVEAYLREKQRKVHEKKREEVREEEVPYEYFIFYIDLLH